MFRCYISHSTLVDDWLHKQPLRKTTYLSLCRGWWVKTSSQLDAHYFRRIISPSIYFCWNPFRCSWISAQLGNDKPINNLTPPKKTKNKWWSMMRATAVGPEVFGGDRRGTTMSKLHLERRQAPLLWPRLRSLTAFGGARTSGGGRSTAGTGGHTTRWTSG